MEDHVDRRAGLRDHLALSLSPVLLDGAMGTELQRRGAPTPLPLWSASANVDHPATVELIHRDYVRAGCRLITTNTFRTTRYVMERAGRLDVWEHWNRSAVALARRAAGDQAWVLGSVTTLEDCYRPDLVPDAETLFEYHSRQVDLLVTLGVDGLLLETFNTIRELDAAYAAALKHAVPLIASVVLRDGFTLYDGTPLTEYARWARRRSPDVLGVNCASPEVLDLALRQLLRLIDRPLGVYANVGRPGGEMGFEFTHSYTPADYRVWVSRWAQMGVRVVGGCCGTTPEYLQAGRQALQTPPGI